MNTWIQYYCNIATAYCKYIWFLVQIKNCFGNICLNNTWLWYFFVMTSVGVHVPGKALKNFVERGNISIKIYRCICLNLWNEKHLIFYYFDFNTLNDNFANFVYFRKDKQLVVTTHFWCFLIRINASWITTVVLQLYYNCFLT